MEFDSQHLEALTVASNGRVHFGAERLASGCRRRDGKPLLLPAPYPRACRLDPYRPPMLRPPERASTMPYLGASGNIWGDRHPDGGLPGGPSGATTAMGSCSRGAKPSLCAVQPSRTMSRCSTDQSSFIDPQITQRAPLKNG